MRISQQPAPGVPPAPPQAPTFSPEEIEAGVALLTKMGASWRATGRVPRELYYATCLNTVTIGIELCCFQVNPIAETLDVLLIWREDEFYHGWHIPGKTLVPGPSSDEMVQRVIADELGPNAQPRMLRRLFTCDTAMGTGPGENVRGQELKRVYGVWLDGTVKEGRWFPVNQLPSGIIAVHVPVLDQAIQAWTR